MLSIQRSNESRILDSILKEARVNKKAIDFGSKEEMDKYMKEHPNADPAHHKVVESKPESKSVDPKKEELKNKTLSDVVKRKKKKELDNAWKDASHGNLDAVLSNPFSTEAGEEFKSTPLHFVTRTIDLKQKNNDQIDKFLKHPQISKLKNNFDNTPLHLLTDRSDNTSNNLNILKHPDIAKVKNKIGNTPLHNLTNVSTGHAFNKEMGKALLNHPELSKVKNEKGQTPLHLLAVGHNNEFNRKNYKLALQHPDVGIVQDDKGNTPLHRLAISYEVSKNPEIALEISKHPDFKRTKNKDDKTPADVFEEAKKSTKPLYLD